VISIGDYAFENAILASISIPGSVTNIGEGAFTGGSIKLTTINVDTNNPAYISVDGVLFDRNQTTLLAYPLA
jgi:hypothetical protein